VRSGVNGGSCEVKSERRVREVRGRSEWWERVRSEGESEENWFSLMWFRQDSKLLILRLFVSICFSVILINFGIKKLIISDKKMKLINNYPLDLDVGKNLC
jgi:hypothetical protein